MENIVTELNDIDYVLKATIENLPYSISISDMRQKDHPLIYVNDSFLQLTGYSREEILHTNCRFLQGERTERRQIQAIKEAIKNRESLSIDLLNYRKDGSAFLNSLKISPVFDSSGQCIAYVGVQNDISDRVEQRKKKMEKNKFEALGLFSSGIAHELNNFLQPVLALPKIIEHDLPSPSQDIIKDLETIEQAAAQAQTLLKKILGYSRPKTENHGVYDLIQSSKQAISFVAMLIPKTIVIEYGEGFEEANPLYCKFDPNELVQVYMNLIKNAADALQGKGIIKINITSNFNRKVTQSTYNTAIVSIQNDGLIPESVKGKLFKKFISSKSETKGTGLGLYLTKEIVENWQGRIDCASEKESGTIFSIYLPVVTDNKENEDV